MHGYFGTYLTVAVLFLIGGAIVGGGLLANRSLRPHRPTPEKLTTYECGVDPVGEGWAQSYIRYYVFAYLYVIFAVDAVYLFPWATVIRDAGIGAASLVEMGIFIAVLVVGLAHAARRGLLRWV
jgi:NADH-quinone oxidoreductase subunit A